MAQDLGAVLVGLQIIFISFLSIPISVLGAIILSWMTHLSTEIRQEVEKGLGSVLEVALGMLGGFLWIVMICYMICSKSTPETGKVAVFMALVSAAFWVVYAVATPWHPESRLSSNVLSAPTVLTGCGQILALKCLIVSILCLLALFIFTCVGESKGIFGKSSKPPHQRGTTTTTTTPSNHIMEDGATERSAQPETMAANGDLEAGTSAPLPSQPESTQTQVNSTAEVVNMAAMDGAG